MVKVDIGGALGFLSESEIKAIDVRRPLAKLETLFENGWMKVPSDYNEELSGKVKQIAAKITDESQVLVVLGIGGSYLGARAAIEYVKSPFYNSLPKKTPDIFFAGNNLSGEYLEQIMSLVGDRNFSVNVVSKSGSTIETAISLRFFKEKLAEKYGRNGVKDRLYVTSDIGSPLIKMAQAEDCAYLEMPPEVGGRYSVLTVVGLLPCACAGIDIDELMRGAKEEFENGLNDECLYAAVRQVLYSKGKKIEMLSCFEPAFRYTGEWWKQLFGESEGKEGKGIFPSYADYSADLHSMGQLIQEGERTLMETFVTFGASHSDLSVPGAAAATHVDKISIIEGLSMHKINASASEAVKKAHIDGGVPVLELKLPEMSAATFGALAYFFMRSCAVSSLVSGVNPFGQPGVEAYKRNLFSILGF